MAKIPEQTITNIRVKCESLIDDCNDILRLADYVNQDSVDWNGVEVVITEDTRQSMIDRYTALKNNIKTLADNLP